MLTRFLAALMKVITASRTFSILYITIKLKKKDFSVFNYLSLYFDIIFLFFQRGVFAFTLYLELK